MEKQLEGIETPPKTNLKKISHGKFFEGIPSREIFKGISSGCLNEIFEEISQKRNPQKNHRETVLN